MKKVLLTGATGFIGFHCVRPLVENGYEVIGTSSKHNTPSPIYKVNLLDKASVYSFLEEHQPTHLLHLAWCTEPPHYWNSPLNLDWHEASIHLLKCFFKFGGERVVVAGTCAEYEWGHPLCEEMTTSCRPGTFYGATKLSLSILAQKMAQLEKKSLAWGRLFHLYGPREHIHRLVPLLIQGLLKNEKVPCSHGQQIRDYLHVQEAADALVALLESKVEGPVNIGSGRSVTIRNIIEIISDRIGNDHCIQLGALPANPKDPLLLIPSIRRLREEVGWGPKMDLETGLDQVISWWKNTMNSKDKNLSKVG